MNNINRTIENSRCRCTRMLAMLVVGLMLIVGQAFGQVSASDPYGISQWPSDPDFTALTNHIGACYQAVCQRYLSAGVTTNSVPVPTFVFPYQDYANLAAAIDNVCGAYVVQTNADGNGCFSAWLAANPNAGANLPTWTASDLHVYCGFSNWNYSVLSSWDVCDRSVQTQLVTAINALQITKKSATSAGTLLSWGGTNWFTLNQNSPQPYSGWPYAMCSCSPQDGSLNLARGVAGIHMGSNCSTNILSGRRLYLKGSTCGGSWVTEGPAFVSNLSTNYFASQGALITSSAPDSTNTDYDADDSIPYHDTQPTDNEGWSVGGGFWVLNWQFPTVSPPPDSSSAQSLPPDSDLDGIVNVLHGPYDSLEPYGSACFLPDYNQPYVHIPLTTDPLTQDGLTIHIELNMGRGQGLPWHWAVSDDWGAFWSSMGTMIPGNIPPGCGWLIGAACNTRTRIIEVGQQNTVRRVSVLRPTGRLVVFDFPWNPANGTFSTSGYPISPDANRTYVLDDNGGGTFTLRFADGIYHQFYNNVAPWPNDGPVVIGRVDGSFVYNCWRGYHWWWLNSPDAFNVFGFSDWWRQTGIEYFAGHELMPARIGGQTHWVASSLENFLPNSGLDADRTVDIAYSDVFISSLTFTAQSSAENVTVTPAFDANGHVLGLSKTGDGTENTGFTIGSSSITHGWGGETLSSFQPSSSGQSSAAQSSQITYNTTDGGSWQVAYTYNAQERLAARTVTAASQTSQEAWSYDSFVQNRYQNGFPAWASVQSYTAPNGVTTTYGYEPTYGWPTSATGTWRGLSAQTTWSYAPVDTQNDGGPEPLNPFEPPRTTQCLLNNQLVAQILTDVCRGEGYPYPYVSQSCLFQYCLPATAPWGDPSSPSVWLNRACGVDPDHPNTLGLDILSELSITNATYSYSGSEGGWSENYDPANYGEWTECYDPANDIIETWSDPSGLTVTRTRNIYGYPSSVVATKTDNSQNTATNFSSTTISFDSLCRPLVTSYSDGTTESASSYCIWGPQQVTRRDGTTATIAYDALGRVRSISDSIRTTTITADALGLDTTITTVQGGVTRATHSVHDLMGRPLLYTDPLGATTWAYSSFASDGSWSVQITPPGGLGTVTEQHYADGSLKAVYGPGAPKCVGNTWSVQGGNLNETITALTFDDAPLNEQTVVTFNSLNLPAGIQQAGVASPASITYDTAFRPKILTDASGITSIRNYDPVVVIQQAGAKLGGDFTTLDPANDRMASFQLSVGGLSETRSANVYPTVGSATPTTLASTTCSYDGWSASSTYAGRTATAQASLTGPGTYSVSASLPNNSTIHAAFGPLGLTSYSLLDSQNGLNTSATITPDPGGLSVQGSTSSGSFIDTYNLAGLLTTHDATASGGSCISIQYLPGTDLPTLITGNGKVFSCQYYENGLPYQISQSGSPTVYYTWDSQGRLQSLTTSQNGQASVTSWDRDPYTGRLADKKVNGVVVASYTWKPNGQLDTLTRGDGGTLQCQYNVAGDLINTLDAATNGTLETINTSCDRMGHALSASVAGGISESYTCGIDGSLQGVQVAGNGVVPNYTLSLPQNSASGLPLGFSASGPAFAGGSGRNLAVSYDAAGRTAGIADGAINAAYGWTSGNSAALMTVAVNGASALTVSNTWNESLGVRTGIAWLLPNGAPVASFAFSRDPGTNLITGITREDGSSRIIAYDTTNQLLSSAHVLPNNTIDETRSYAYAYDGSGNMIQGGRVGPSGEGRDSFTANGFNFQIVRTWNAVDLVGVASTNARVMVNGIPTTRQGTRFVASIPLTSGSAACATTLVVGAVVSTGSNTENYAEAVVPLRLPACPESIQTSLAGTTVSDSLSEYLYDARNLLRRVTDHVGNPRLQSVYDYYPDSRRARKTVSIWTNGAWRVSSVHQYIYDRWSLIREISSNSVGTVTRDYTWGVDLSGMRGGAWGQESGGIGGLVAITEVVSRNQQPGVTNILLPVCDQVGTVVALVAAVTNNLTLATPTVVATYEYTPFGDLISRDGPYAHSCPFGFHSKYRDPETGFLYYGHRYYDPRCGKWQTNDPIEESGGINLTAFCGNDPVNNVDALGLLGEGFALQWLANQVDQYIAQTGSPTLTFSGEMVKWALNSSATLDPAFTDYNLSQHAVGVIAANGAAKGSAILAREAGQAAVDSLTPITDVRRGMDPSYSTLERAGYWSGAVGKTLGLVLGVKAIAGEGLEAGTAGMAARNDPVGAASNVRYLEYKILRAQGNTASEAHALMKHFDAGSNLGNAYAFHFTTEEKATGMLDAGVIRASRSGVAGPGVYAGTTPTPGPFLKNVPFVGWGLAGKGTNVRVPIPMENPFFTPWLPLRTIVFPNSIPIEE